MQVSELSGALLDYWVARAEGFLHNAETDLFRPGEVRIERIVPTGHGHELLQFVAPGNYCIVRNKLRDGDPPPHPCTFMGSPYSPSTDWALGGPIIECDQIFLQPPSEVHYNGGPSAGWKRYDHWRATVSARTRTLPPKNEFQESFNVRGVGRGAGETALLAAMRAKAASHYGDEVPDVDLAKP